MKKGIILLSSILLCWACKENVETSPACNPKAIPALSKHLVGKWNTIGAIANVIGMRSTMELNENGSINSPIEFIDYSYVDRGIKHDFFDWKVSTKEPNYVFFRPYDKGSDGFLYPYFADVISCDRVDFVAVSGRLTLYKDNYKIPALCGADTSKGNIENWLIGKWNYTIVQYPYAQSNLIRTPKGIVDFNNDFTITDSNPYGIVDAISTNDLQTGTSKPTKLMWMKVGGTEKEYFFILGNQNQDVYYEETGDGFCGATTISCNKIIFETRQGHEVTLDRIK